MNSSTTNDPVHVLNRLYWMTFRDLAIRSPDEAALRFGASPDEVANLARMNPEEFDALIHLPGPAFQPRLRLCDALRPGARARLLLSKGE
ncbi:MAG: hypothetical protein ACYDHY_13125 [Acidiferrobacterales bacterium]